MSARYAVYFAPPPGSALAEFGAVWLGRDCADGTARAQPAVDGLSPTRLAEITTSPRHYGFHGTLKPPFALADGCCEADLLAAVAAFAAARAGFDAPPLRVAALSGFTALVLSAPCPAMRDLAADCVRDLDRFRAPAGAAELARRRAAGLSPRQDALLRAWGYPYVMDEFRFHMTLTERLPAADRAVVMAALAPLAAPVTEAPLQVDGIAVFHQPDRESPFNLLRRFPFESGSKPGV